MKMNLLNNQIAYNELEKLQKEFVESDKVSMIRNYLADSSIRIPHIELVKELLKEDQECYNELAGNLQNLVELGQDFKIYLAFRQLYFESVSFKEIRRFIEKCKDGEYSVERLISKYILMGEYGYPKMN